MVLILVLFDFHAHVMYAVVITSIAMCLFRVFIRTSKFVLIYNLGSKQVIADNIYNWLF